MNMMTGATVGQVDDDDDGDVDDITAWTAFLPSLSFQF